MNKVRLSETDFSSQIESLLRLYQWRWTHFRPAWSSKGYRTPIKGDKGFPDYCAVRNGMCLFIELKDDKTKLSPEQEAWAKELQTIASNNVGVMYCLWRSSMFDEANMILR